VSWRREWIGSFAFVVLAVAYGLVVTDRVDWIIVVSGPLLVVGTLYFWNWRARAALHNSR
jgi:hypothetical protein